MSNAKVYFILFNFIFISLISKEKCSFASAIEDNIYLLLDIDQLSTFEAFKLAQTNTEFRKILRERSKLSVTLSDDSKLLWTEAVNSDLTDDIVVYSDLGSIIDFALATEDTYRSNNMPRIELRNRAVFNLVREKILANIFKKERDIHRLDRSGRIKYFYSSLFLLESWSMINSNRNDKFQRRMHGIKLTVSRFHLDQKYDHWDNKRCLIRTRSLFENQINAKDLNWSPTFVSLKNLIPFSMEKFNIATLRDIDFLAENVYQQTFNHFQDDCTEELFDSKEEWDHFVERYFLHKSSQSNELKAWFERVEKAIKQS